MQERSDSEIQPVPERTEGAEGKFGQCGESVSGTDPPIYSLWTAGRRGAELRNGNGLSKQYRALEEAVGDVIYINLLRSMQVQRKGCRRGFFSAPGQERPLELVKNVWLKASQQRTA